MIIPFTQVDAFIVDGKPLTGNPAAVMPLEDWLPDKTLQAIAIENNLSETAFMVPSDGGADHDLRWFTPGGEVKMCGHATIASGHALIGDAERVTFSTQSGILSVERDGDRLMLDLPAADIAQPTDQPAIVEALGGSPKHLLHATAGEDAFIAVYDNEAAVRAVSPDFAALKPFSELIIITAPGDETDIASRVFAPFFNIDEDPVTGAAHAAICPWWADQLGRDRFSALQASARGGHLDCTVAGDRVRLGGQCVTVIEGEFSL